mgnify:CR=1 FL=1
MSIRMKKICMVTAFIIVTAVILAICVTYFIGGQAVEFDGILV